MRSEDELDVRAIVGWLICRLLSSFPVSLFWLPFAIFSIGSLF